MKVGQPKQGYEPRFGGVKTLPLSLLIYIRTKHMINQVAYREILDYRKAFV